MNQFLLKIIGIDVQILEFAKLKKCEGFIVCGLIAISVFVLSILGSYYVLTYLVKDHFVDALIAFLFASIVFNFYRFTITTISWRAEEIEKPGEVHRPDMSSTIIKMIACGFFIVLISKMVELWIFSGLIERWLQKSDGGALSLYRDIDILHNHYPYTWAVTILLLSILLWPIWFRSCSNRFGNNQYESVNSMVLVYQIRKEFEWFEEKFNKLFSDKGIRSSFAFEERCYNKKDIRIVYTSYRTNYANPPFDTELKKAIVNTRGRKLKEGTSKTFFDLLDKLEQTGQKNSI
jgi:hypothetical protein